MTTERRRYYRIEDVALIKYRVVAEDALADERERILSHELMAANLQVVLSNLESRLQEIMGALRAESRIVAEAVEVLNRKLTVLGRVVSLESPHAGASEHREHEPTRVSISGGGIGLNAGVPLALNANLVIDLVLLPGNHAMRMIGRVAECRKAPSGGFFVGIEFDSLREEDRDVLVQHIVRRQSALLREERLERPARDR